MDRKKKPAIGPDCATCIYRKECANVNPGTFCTKWRDTPPPDRGPDPNDAWIRGEDNPF